MLVTTNGVSVRAKPAAERSPAHAAQRVGAFPIVIVGHVDHGKSTIIGRLLADTGLAAGGKARGGASDLCERTAKPFEYAFLLDALKDEQAQGITIDAARVFFKTRKRALHHHRRARPRRVPQEHGHRRGARRSRAARHRRAGRRAGELAAARLPAVDARHPADRRGREQDGSRRRIRPALRAHRRPSIAAFLSRVGVEPRAIIPGQRPRRRQHRARSTACRGTAARPCSRRSTGLQSRPPRTERRSACRCRTSTSSPTHGDDRRIVAGHGRRAAGFASATRWCSIRRASSGASSARGVQSGRADEATRPVRRPDSRSTTRSTSRAASWRRWLAAATVVGTRLRVSVFWLGERPAGVGKDYAFEARHRARAGASEHDPRVHRRVEARSVRADATRSSATRSRSAVLDCVAARVRSSDGFARDRPVRARRRLRHQRRRHRAEALAGRPDAGPRRRPATGTCKWEAGALPGTPRRALCSQRPTRWSSRAAGRRPKALARELESRLFDDGRFGVFPGHRQRPLRRRRRHRPRTAQSSRSTFAGSAKSPTCCSTPALVVIATASTACEELDRSARRRARTGRRRLGEHDAATSAGAPSSTRKTAPTEPPRVSRRCATEGATSDHADGSPRQLEHRSVHILREAYASFRSLCMLWSIGKDSTVLLWLARKAFFGHVPFPLVHIDTSFKIPEMIAYRDRLAAEWSLHDDLRPERGGAGGATDLPRRRRRSPHVLRLLKTEALEAHAERRVAALRLQSRDRRRTSATPISEPYTGVIVGARADEEGSRSKERYFSPRDDAERLGHRRSAARVLEPVQDRVRAGHARAHSSAARLDRAEHLGVHRARDDSDRVAVLRSGRRARATARSAAGRAPAPVRVRRDVRRGDHRRAAGAGSSRTSPSAPAARRTRTTAAGSRRCGATATCRDGAAHADDEERVGTAVGCQGRPGSCGPARLRGRAAAGR